MGKSVGKMIAWIIGLVVFGAIFLGLLLWGVTDRIGKGGHPIFYGLSAVLFILIISMTWSSYKHRDDEGKEDIKDNY